MSNSTCDHIIDFFVITAADLCAAWIALKYFESRQRKTDSKLEKAEQRLDELSQLVAPLSSWVNKLTRGYANGSEHSGVGIGELQDWNENASRLLEDSVFWSFEKSAQLKPILKDLIPKYQAVLNSRTVGQARSNLIELRQQIDHLQDKIQEHV